MSTGKGNEGLFSFDELGEGFKAVREQIDYLESKLDSLVQESHARQIEPKLELLMAQLDMRKEVWLGLTSEKRARWIKSGKDSIMALAWKIFKYLEDDFFDGIKRYDYARDILESEEIASTSTSKKTVPAPYLPHAKTL